MPFTYKPGSEITSEAPDRISKCLDRQNELLEKLIKAVAKDNKK